jgi:hypothetical protein
MYSSKGNGQIGGKYEELCVVVPFVYNRKKETSEYFPQPA